MAQEHSHEADQQDLGPSDRGNGTHATHHHDHDHTTEHAGDSHAGHDHHPGAHSHAGQSHAGHNHLHGVTDLRRIGWAFAIIAVFMVIEVIGGLMSGSLALIADAGHMVSDTAALGFSWLAIVIGRRQATVALSYGYKRLEILAAFVNGLALFVIAGWIIVEAFRRFWMPVHVLGGPMLVVAVLGFLANIAAFFVLNGGNRDNLNMRSAWLHVLGDLLGSAVAIVAALVILLTGWTPVDPILSIFVAIIVLKSAWQIVKSSAHILLEGVPPSLNLAEVKTELEAALPEVREVHHIHAWSITGEQHLLTLHVVPNETASSRAVITAVKDRLRERFSIEHVTVQVDEGGCIDHTRDAAGTTAKPPACR